MQTVPLRLEDLEPREATFTLSTRPDDKFTLCRWSLRVRAWVTAKHTPEELQKIFEMKDILKVAEIAFYMLKEKEKFDGYDGFLDAVASIQDQINLIKAVVGTIGLGEPELAKVQSQLEKGGQNNDPNDSSPNS